jgi:mannosyltransferase OCH1-like enzyme
MIPKKIHYCWFGGNEKPANVIKCINSWKKFCPDYEIIEWNENNFDINQLPYMMQAYEAKKYAFVSDVARLIIVYENGGVYLDTDVELIKPIDELLNNKAFFGFENDENVASGLGFGAESGVELIKKHIEQYEDERFVFEDGSYNLKTCPKYLTELLVSKGLVPNGSEQIIEGVHIYPSEYFNPYDSLTGKLNKTDKTYSIHWYDASWSGMSSARLKMSRFVRRIFGQGFLEGIKKRIYK